MVVEALLLEGLVESDSSFSTSTDPAPNDFYLPDHTSK